MRVNADIYVKDVPGQLVGSLEPISMVDGNIVGVVHHHEKVLNDRIGVNITFDIESPEHLDRLKTIWKERDVTISRLGSVVETYPVEYLFIGNVTPSFLERLVSDATEILGIESVDMRYSSRTNSKKRAAMMLARVRTPEDMEKLDSFFLQECRKTDILVIRGLGQ